MTCGVASVGITGVWFVAGSVVRDRRPQQARNAPVGQLGNRAGELKPGVPVSEATATRLDYIATLTTNLEPHWQSARHPRTRRRAQGAAGRSQLSGGRTNRSSRADLADLNDDQPPSTISVGAGTPCGRC